MGKLSLSTLQKTGQTVSAEMFGANAVFSATDDGLPGAAYQDAADVLGVQNIRFGGGQADLDPTKANDAGITPVDGETAINIVEMPDGELRSELVRFLDWAQAETAAGNPISVSLIIPTKHLSTEDYVAFASQIEIFAETVMARYGNLISAFEIGNEYWEIGETAYGMKASLAAEALARGMAAAGVAEAAQPEILVQMATAGNEGSEFPRVAGVNDFIPRLTAANAQIIDQLSGDARAAIDGVVEHYYYNKSDLAFREGSMAVNHIDRDFDLWTDALGDDLSLHITEWNVKTTATEQQGIAAASTLVHQFENMIALGADSAQIWALDYHSRTALTLDTDAGSILDSEGRLINSASGAVFDLMSEALVGKELVTASFDGEMQGLDLTAYASTTEMVFYISSRSFDRQDVTLNLADGLPSAGRVEVVQISMDAGTSNGLQWLNGEAADHVMLDRQPYYYNEHDVDVVLTDRTYADAGDIDLTLNPFEVVQLTVALGPQDDVQVDPPQDPAKNAFVGTSGDDRIDFADTLHQIDGGSGRDTLVIAASRAEASVSIEDDGSVALATAGREANLTDVERLAFSDGTLALDTDDGTASLYRLYEASFDRTPDAEGLGFWVTHHDDGMDLLEIAGHFITSDEFSAAYGPNATLSDTAFIDLLYANVLDRTPDAAGYAFWRGHQEAGLGRADILLAFSESPENRETVAPLIDDGIWLT